MNAAQRAVQSAVPSGDVTPDPTLAVRAAREDSVPTALPLVPATPAGRDAESPIPPQIREAAARFLGAFTIPKGTDVLRASGLHAAHLRHREAAAHWEAAIIRLPRQMWGLLHLLLKACLGLLDWVTESPARTFVAAIFLVACIKWL